MGAWGARIARTSGLVDVTRRSARATVDPRRLHLHIGRGNQLRATVVLADDVLQEYARDLQQRWLTYRALIDDGRLIPTQNRAFDEFEQRLREIDLDRLVREEQTLTPAALRERNLSLLERLNPGRVFRIRMPLDDVVRRWMAEVRPEDHRRLDVARRLELVNALLPNRLWVAEVEPGLASEVDALVARVPTVPGTEVPAELREHFTALLGRVSHGFYPVHDGPIAFDEFTAIYPVGTSTTTRPGTGSASRTTRHRAAARSRPTNGRSPSTTSPPTSRTATRHGCRTSTSAPACTTPFTRCGGRWSARVPRSCRRRGAKAITTTATASPSAICGCSRAARCRTAAPM